MTDEQAMNDVKKGNLDRAALLFERYHVQLYNYFARLTFDREMSHDLTQNVFVRMIRYRGSYQEDASFRSWIYQIARNVFNDQYLKEKKHRKNAHADVETIAHETAALLDEQEQAERELALEKAMSLLDPEQRELLILSKFQKMKYHEIGEMLNMTEANVKVKVHRAIQKLKGLYFMVEG